MNQEIVTKKCSNPNCNQPIKPISEFYKNKAIKSGLANYCKTCSCKIGKKWRIDNPDKERNRHIKYNLKHPDYNKNNAHAWYLNNTEKCKTNTKEYRKLHKKQLNQTANKRDRLRRLTDPNYRYIKNTRRYINNSLKNYKKSESTKNKIGITLEENKNYIELQFYNNMTWESQGKNKNHWQIHHICPIEFFDLNDPIEQKQAFFYTNTKPLWYEDHCEEHRKINERMSQYENNGRPIM